MSTTTDSPRLHPTRCAICGTTDGSQGSIPNSSIRWAFTPSVFSARRLPDRTHYRMVRCRTCGLVRSDPVLDPEAMAGLYRESTFEYGDELEGIRATYGAALDRLGAVAAGRGLLDVGCGSGFVLELAQDRGWKRCGEWSRARMHRQGRPRRAIGDRPRRPAGGPVRGTSRLTQ